MLDRGVRFCKITYGPPIDFFVHLDYTFFYFCFYSEITRGIKNMVRMKHISSSSSNIISIVISIVIFC